MDKEREGEAGAFPSREEGERASSSSWSRRGPMGSAIRKEGPENKRPARQFLILGIQYIQSVIHPITH